MSICTLETLAVLHEAVTTFFYPLSVALPILEVIEAPAEKLERVRRLLRPTEGFDYRGVLDEIWAYQQGAARGDVVSYRAIWQARADRWGVAEFREFERKLIGLEALTSLIRLVPEKEHVTLLQQPRLVAESIQKALDERRAQQRTSQETQAAPEAAGLESGDTTASERVR